MLKIKVPINSKQKTITPDPKGKLRLFTKNTSNPAANEGSPGTIRSLMKITIPTLIARAAMTPHRLGWYFLK